MAAIKLSPDERAALLAPLKGYCRDELELELGGFQAEFLLDFILERVGPAIYNRALYDAQAHLAGRVEGVLESLVELEKIPHGE